MRHTAVSVFPRNFGPNLLIVLLLGLGLGTTTLLYSALDRLLLHPLRVPDVGRLVRVEERHPPVTSWTSFPYILYESMRPMHSFDALAVEGEADTTILPGARAVPALGSMVSGSYFSMLGARVRLGRALTQADESVGAEVPVVLSHRIWVRDFGESAAALGATLYVQGRPFTIVGIMPQGFFGTRLDANPDFWIPLAAQHLLSEKSLTDPAPDQQFSIIGRLREGVTVAQAQAEFAGVYQGSKENGDKRSQGLIVPIAEGSFALREQFDRALNLLLWGLGALLAMVCASVAGILVARAVRWERETAVRMALGASHLRLAQRAFFESMALGVTGAGWGLTLAYLCAPFLTGLLPAGRTPLPVSLLPDARTDLLIAGLALSVSLVFGTIPAWLATRVAPQLALRGGTATRRSGKLSRGLMIFETGATLVLLTGTGLLLHTFYRLRHTDPGFDVEHLVTFTLNPNLLGGNAKVSAALPQQLGQQVLGLPGVRGVGFSSMAVMQRIGMKTSVALPGLKITPRDFLNTSLNSISSGFFQALGIPLVAGRGFEETDALRSSPTPTLINEAFARTFFRGENPLGKSFGMGATGDVAKAGFVVIGVVGDSKYRSLRESLLPIFYTPMTQRDMNDSEIYLYVRTADRPEGIIRAVREALSEREPQLPIVKVETMQEQVNDSLWQERLLVALAVVFSSVSVLLSGLGLYGLLGYDASQRTREFGIRVAVGAQRSDVGRLMIGELAGILAPGLVLGGIGCVLLAGLIAPTLYGIGPYDAVAWSGALLAVLGIGTAAAWHPVRRAMGADPAEVLRDE
jgi:predicted permease